MADKKIKFFAYFGSKTYMLDDIYKIINPLSNKITCFVDVFGGSGVVALNLPFKVKVIVYNDLDDYLYKTFKVIQDNEKRKLLLEKLFYAFRHKKVFDEFKEDMKNKKELDDVEISFRTIYLSQNSFNGGSSSFKRQIKINRDFVYQSYCPILNFSEKIKYWIIDNLDYKEIIKKYDSDSTFFYLDPPYIKGGKKYKISWNLNNFIEMKNILDKIKGYWLMNESEIDFKYITSIFGEPKFTKEYVSYCINLRQSKQSKRKKRIEGFWFNFEYNEKNPSIKLNNFIQSDASDL